MYGELYIPPVPTYRNRETGRFMKGHVPANKGVKDWQKSLPKRSQKRIAKGWKNVVKYRPKQRPDTAGRSKKRCVMLTDDGKFHVFAYLYDAAMFVKGRRENIGRCCRLNFAKHENKHKPYDINTDHRYMGYRWYFESDPCWFEKIGVVM